MNRRTKLMSPHLHTKQLLERLESAVVMAIVISVLMLVSSPWLAALAREF